ncbi:MAG: SUMF1/EgtB/PvdO family nonheme iron enzyme [Myxococcales bacterium]|nr:SUMF1/EgtB/PvdO family nonheme iron enzyme [Myxococcales bacterium]
MRRALAAAAVLGAAALSTCSPFTADGGGGGGGADASPEGAVGVGSDGGGSDILSRSDPGCPGPGRGPAMARVGNVCIDRTEVSNAHYLAFLNDKAKSTAGLPAPCTNHTPTAGSTVPGACPSKARADGRFPVSCVTFCDATAFCRWSGRRLCGALGSGDRVSPAANIGYSVDEWTHACGAAKGDLYAGGGKPSNACALSLDELPDGFVPYGAHEVDLKRCEGPAGVFDLAGNVSEWVNACNTDNTKCRVAGESYSWADPDDPGRCTYADDDPPLAVYTDLGFRCCATPN